jgi:hypothetical protein
VHVQTGSLDQKILGPFRDKWEGRRPRISVLGPIPCGATSRPIEIKVRSSTGVTDPLWDHHVLLKLSGRESRGIVSAIPRGWQRDWLESRSRFEAVPEFQILFGITTRSRSFRVERAWVAKELIGSEIKVRSSAGVTDPFWDHHTLLKLSG